jgi:hypothetical protein
MTQPSSAMWVIQVFSAANDELVAERELGSVDQYFLTKALGDVPTAFASIPLDRDMLERLGAEDLATGVEQEAFLELHDDRTPQQRKRDAAWWPNPAGARRAVG